MDSTAKVQTAVIGQTNAVRYYSRWSSYLSQRSNYHKAWINYGWIWVCVGAMGIPLCIGVCQIICTPTPFGASVSLQVQCSGPPFKRSSSLYPSFNILSTCLLCWIEENNKWFTISTKLPECVGPGKSSCRPLFLVLLKRLSSCSDCNGSPYHFMLIMLCLCWETSGASKTACWSDYTSWVCCFSHIADWDASVGKVWSCTLPTRSTATAATKFFPLLDGMSGHLQELLRRQTIYHN